MAYASVASLLNTINVLLTSNSRMLSQICDRREEFHGLREKVSSLEVFVKKFEKSNGSREMKDLEAQIKEVADDVEITIQLRLTDIIMAKNETQKEKARERLCDSLKQIAEEIDRVEKESTKIQYKANQSSEEYFVQASSSAKVILNGKNNMVGRRDERERMMVELTRDFSGELKVIPIVGMGGIGKTTLAKEVFDDASIRSHFDVHAWVTVSQEHKVKDILVSLLQSTKGKDDTLHREDESKLADMLQKSLKSKRYLIVLDDMWSDKAWEDVRLCFPSENRGSRILLTTRNTEVACSAGTKNISLTIGLMSPVESWDLFKNAALVNEALPSGFETIGKKIVERCQGLPLTIVVVAGLLSKSKRTIEDWESVAKDVKSFLTNDPDEQCLHVLGLSYNHLTSDLKACLLYFGIFPEDSEVSVKRLVRLWIAEGFLKFEKDLEGVAEKCLQDLIDRCLVLISDRSSDGTRIRSCKVHDVIYELCLREAQKQKLLVMNDIVYVDREADYSSDEDDDWDEYEYLDEAKYDYVDQDYDDDEDEENDLDLDEDAGDDLDDEDEKNDSDDDEDDLEAEDGDNIMLFKNKFCLLKHIMGPFKRQTNEGKSRSDCYRAGLTPGHHHLIRRKSDDADNIMLFKNKFRLFKHIMGPFKRQTNGFDCYRALLTPGHHHLITRKSDDADNNLLKRTRSIFINNYSVTFSLKSKLFHFSLVRILDLSHVLLDRFPPQILCLIWLRYLELSGYFDIPKDICRLWNLKTFIVNGICGCPKEIWELTQLRHLELGSFMMPNPPSISVDEERCSGFPNIHIISGLYHDSCTKEVISGIRNVRKLKVQGDSDDYGSFQESTLFNNLVDLHQLETLSVTISGSDVLRADKPVTIPSAKTYPATLKKLKLCRTGLCWDDLNIIGELPNLEVLKLRFDAVGEEWYPIAGGFSRLKILMIKKSGLKYWKITNDDFPVLERLIIKGCTELEEIPIEFTETNSLQLIELKGCSPQLEDSATRIQQEQEDLGNKPVDVRISSYNYSDEDDVV